MASYTLTANDITGFSVRTVKSSLGGSYALPVFSVSLTPALRDAVGNIAGIDYRLSSIQCSILKGIIERESTYTSPNVTLVNNNDFITLGETNPIKIQRINNTSLTFTVGVSSGTVNCAYTTAARRTIEFVSPALLVFSNGNVGLCCGVFETSYKNENVTYSLSNGSVGYCYMAAADTYLNYVKLVPLPPENVIQYVKDFYEETTPFIEDTDPYSDINGEDEIPDLPGGSGTDDISIPQFPGLSATSTGIIGLFAPSAAQMQQLADYMWTDFGGTGTTVEDILSEVVQALKRSISNPLDYVIGLNIIPSQGLSIGASQVIKFGFTSSGVSMPRLSSQYFTVDCGTISFDYLCGNTFLDYAPYSKFSIYLPYIGVKDVDANDFVGHTIGVVYHGDTVTGGVTAYITKDGSVMYQYSGCCALNIPLSADGWGSTISGAVQIATSLVAGAATLGAAGVSLAAAKGAASVASNPSMLSPQVSHSGAISGGAGCMGVQYPFVIREAVRFHSTSNFNKVSGYPSYYYRSLGDVEGYTTVFDVHLENISATRGEIAEIERLLKEGVIF